MKWYYVAIASMVIAYFAHDYINQGVDYVKNIADKK